MTLATKSPLAVLFPTASAKVLDFLLDHRRMSFTLQEIMNQCSLSPSTMSRTIPTLLQENMIQRVRRSYSYHYTVNLTSQRCRDLLQYVHTSMNDDTVVNS